jgi:hypothetical protein
MDEPDASGPGATESSGVSTKTVEIVTAAAILAFGATVIVDAVRLGHGWESDGPQPGFYPFYVGLLMCAAAGMIVWQQLRGGSRRDFVERGRFKPVLTMLLPSVVFVAAIFVLGLYVSSALFLVGFMRWQGGFGLLRTLPIAIGVPAVAFALFELWFSVPLPKGPLEALFGY